MFGKGFRLFSLFGFQVRLDASWLVLAFLVTWTLALGYFPARIPGRTASAYWFMGIAGAVGLFASIVLHEFAHALIARRHNLPIRGITLFIFGGVAEMEAEAPSPKAEFFMAIAGPVMSVLIGGALLGLVTVMSDMLSSSVATVLFYLGSINLIIAGFNLVPAFPLDGGRVLRAWLWHRRGDVASATRAAARVGSGFGLVLMSLGVFTFLLGGLVGGLWYFVLGLFLRGLAKGAYQQVLLGRALKGEPVRRFMRKDPVAVSPDTSIQSLVDDYVYRHHHKLYPVVDAGRLAGCVTVDQIRAVPRSEWPNQRVADIAANCSDQNTIAPDASALDALKQMQRAGRTRLVVARDDRLEGVLTAKDLLDFFALKMELEH